MDNKTLIKNIAPEELRDLLTIASAMYAKSVGQNVDDKDLTFIIEMMFRKVTEEAYLQWSVGMLKNVFKAALEDVENKNYKLTLRNFYIWLSRARAVYMKNQTQNTTAANYTLTPAQHEEARWYAVAVTSRVKSWKPGNSKSATTVQQDVAALKEKYNNDVTRLGKPTAFQLKL